MWSLICSPTDIPEGKIREFKLQGQPIAIAHVKDKFYCFAGLCTHASCPLAGGDLKDYLISCYCHASQFDIRTGQVITPPATVPIKTYPLKIENAKVLIQYD